MRNLIRITLLILFVLISFSAPVQAHGGRGGHGYGWGPVFGLGLLGLGLWELSQPHYYYPAYQERVYVQPVPQQPVTTGYWYYCRDPEGYYPYVDRCPTGWLRVVPSPPPVR